MMKSLVGTRAVLYQIFAKWISIWVRSNIRREQILDPSQIKFSPAVWFHAASAGEWESLVPVARKYLQSDPKLQICCTVFSASGYGSIKKFESEFPGRVVAGLSPTEGHWSRFLNRVKPSLMVTAKYEAWPELWMACSKAEVPIWILGVIPRSSLVWVRRVLRALGVALPKLRLFFPLAKDQSELQKLFPSAQMTHLDETRWDQVAYRNASGSTKKQELIESVSSLPRPWGVLGSFWESDLPVIEPIVAKSVGTLFVFPHDVSRSNSSWVRYFSKFGKARAFETGIIERDAKIVVVNQLGYLAEFYSEADWVYVGGGFGKGVHSTIEPAIHGLPIACGPKNMTRFPEIESLQDLGQLQVVRNSDQAWSWFLKLSGLQSETRAQWKLRNQSRLGTASVVAGEMLKERERIAQS